MKAHVVEHSSYRFWDHWISDGRVPHVFTVDVETGRMRDLFAGSKYELMRADTTAQYYDISPDGREIAFGFLPGDDKRFDAEQQLVALEVKSGKFRALTGTRLSHEFPRYSPDGRSLALLTQDLGALTRQMDALNMAIMVNLSGRSGPQLAQAAARIRSAEPSRLVLFANIEFDGFGTAGWIENTVGQI